MRKYSCVIPLSAAVIGAICAAVTAYVGGHLASRDAYLRTRYLADSYAAERDSALHQLEVHALAPPSCLADRSCWEGGR